MQFSPNKTQRYFAALRQEQAKRITRYGYSDSSRRRLEKILTAEILFEKPVVRSTDLHETLKNILFAVFLKEIKKGVFMKLKFGVSGKALTDNRALALLFCSALSRPLAGETYVKVKTENNKLLFFTKGYALTATAKRAAKKLDAAVFTLPHSNTCGYKISFISTSQNPEKNTSAREYLTNPFSLVNILIP